MKILLLSESIAGSGHTKAAENLAKGMRRVFPEAKIKVDTTLPQVSPLLEKCSSRLYMGTIRHASPIWGWAYERDRQWSFLGKNVLKKFIAKRLAPYITQESPDLIVSTHAFCLGGLAELKRAYGQTFSLSAALTDYCVNPFWAFEEVDTYFVGAEPIKSLMTGTFQLPSERIHVTGIPIDPDFAVQESVEGLRQKLGVPLSSKLILISGGGLGLAPYQEIVMALQDLDHEIFIVLFTGTNRQAFLDCKTWLNQKSYRHPVLVLDYVTNMNEWMRAADLMIGKPGGLTVSEAFASHLPLLIYRPIPGQEERNSRFLLQNRIAMRAQSQTELFAEVDRFLGSAGEIEDMRQRILPFSKPTASIDASRILAGLQ